MNIDQRPLAPSPYEGLEVPTFTLSSSVLTDGAPMPESATAEAGSLSPDLTWHGFPEDTASFMTRTPRSPRAGGTGQFLISLRP